jgi:hypothetical protein
MTKNPEGSKQQRAWVSLDEQLDIVGQVNKKGIITLSADDIRPHISKVGVDLRNLTYLPVKAKLPQFLKDNDLSVLPTSPSRFVLGRFDAYKDMPEMSDEPIQIVEPADLATLRLRSDSEASGILAALNSGVFEDFLDESSARLGIMGRMRSRDFSYRVEGHNGLIKVKGTQIEIDAGIETPNSVALVEAKTARPETFLVRQLYYPYRVWEDTLRSEKKVRPIVMLVSGDRFTLHEYRFNTPKVYSSIELVKSKVYQLADGLVPDSVITLALSAPVIPIPKAIDIPYPQADDLDNVLDLLDVLHASGAAMKRGDVADLLVNLGERQIDYYIGAAKYLGYIPVADRGSISLTIEGETLAQGGISERAEILSTRLLRDPVIRDVFLALVGSKTPPGMEVVKKKALEMVRAHEATGEIDGLGGVTMARRARSTAKWCAWVLERHTK